MSTSRAVTVSFWSIVLSTGLLAESQQGADADRCGRVLSLTCASPTSSARLLFKAGDRDSYTEVIIPAEQRADVVARIGDAPSGRLVCVASDVGRGRSLVTNMVLSRPQQLTIRDDMQVDGRLASAFSTCDLSVQPPVPLREVRPSYTADDLRARTDGAVLLHGIVDEEGQVIDVRIVRSLSAGLDNESTRAFGQWRFQPAMRHGKPVAVAITGEFQFHAGLESERLGR
jgi:TonB family protein